MKLYALTALLALLLCTGCTEYRNKQEYSVLQLAEYQGRVTSISGVTFRTIDNLQVAGFPTDDHRANTWVLLNPKHAPYWKQMPAGCQFTISEEVLDVIRANNDVSKKVIAVLETHVAKSDRGVIPPNRQ
jgi:hypothetical protein